MTCFVANLQALNKTNMFLNKRVFPRVKISLFDHSQANLSAPLARVIRAKRLLLHGLCAFPTSYGDSSAHLDQARHLGPEEGRCCRVEDNLMFLFAFLCGWKCWMFFFFFF